MRQVLLHVFYLSVIVLLSLTGCGGAPSPTADQAVATIGAGLNPATLPPAEPTLTAKEKQDFATIAARAASMTKAAQELQTLGQAVRADVAWKTKVRTAAQVISGGQKTIAQIQFSDYYAPLAKRTKAAIEGCGGAAEAILASDIDALTPAAVSAHQDELTRWCVIELERVRQTIESLN